MAPFRRLLGRATPYRWAFVAAFGAAVTASVLDGTLLALLIPLLRLLFGASSGLPEVPTAVERVLAWVAGGLLDPGDRGSAIRNVVLLVLTVVVLKNAALVAAGALTARVQEQVGRDLRVALHDHLTRLDLEFFHRTRGGQLLSRATADVDQAKTIVSASLVSALQNGGVIVVYVAMLVSLSWRLGLLALAAAPVVVLVLRPVLAGVRRRGRRALDERGELAAVLSESVEGARIVKAHGAEEYERRRFAAAVGRHFRTALRTERAVAAVSPLSETLGALAFVLLLIGGTQLAGGPTLRPEVLVAFLAVALRLLPPVKRLSQFPASAAQALAAAERVFEVLDVPAADVDPPHVARFPGLRRAIELRDVWVRYGEDDWVLRGVNLTIRRGEVIALVGPSGAGKSTIADLLPRFVDPARGAVVIDGVPIARYGRRSLRAAMGIVGQHTVIFNDTVRRNIAYGEQADASDDAVRAAARAANALGFIERLPQGFATRLGERGMRLSGGERQRIAIARALLRDAPILILDEATSNLDAESERLVQHAIARLMEHRTVLVIAHRLSTVARADRIVVLENGAVVQTGRHEELLEAGGVYGRLYA
ncbi:MAG: ABC transporter ATP-binding protein [Gemmatimonadales bacterium]|jgi:subfamily B ATP-binding cassette protein MsbA